MSRASGVRRIAAAVTLAAAVTSCTSADDATSTTVPPPPSSSTRPDFTTTEISPTDSTAVAPTTTVAPTLTTGTSYDVLIETTLEGEVVVTGPEVLRVSLGSTVDLTILSSIDDMLHIHGYHLFFVVTAGEETPIDFVADVPGIFEAELEGGHVPVFELEVSP